MREGRRNAWDHGLNNLDYYVVREARIGARIAP